MTLLTLLSWNLNGARAAYRTGFLSWLADAAPDILCLQETRADADQLPAEMRQPAGYHAFWHGSERKKGYSGTALLSRRAPDAVQFGLGVPEFDDEGRTIVAHYPDFTLINCYFPNGSRDHSRVPYKLAFYDAFLALCERLRGEGGRWSSVATSTPRTMRSTWPVPRRTRTPPASCPKSAPGWIGWLRTVMLIRFAASTPT